jgi:hypothetical protein
VALAKTVVEILSPQLIVTEMLLGELVSLIVPFSVNNPLDDVVAGTEKLVKAIEGTIRSSSISSDKGNAWRRMLEGERRCFREEFLEGPDKNDQVDEGGRLRAIATTPVAKLGCWVLRVLLR